MQVISLFEAKTHLSRLVNRLIEGKDKEVVISRHGKPLVRLIPIETSDTSKRIGLARGRFEVPDDIDGANAAIAAMFAQKKKDTGATAP